MHRDHRDKSQPKFGKDRVVPTNIFDNINITFLLHNTLNLIFFTNAFVVLSICIIKIYYYAHPSIKILTGDL